MIQITNTKRGLASLAVFRQAYEQKKDIYAIISAYIQSIIYARSLQTFTSVQMAKWLKEDDGFDIVDSIVRLSIRRLAYVKKEKDVFIVDNASINRREAEDQSNQCQQFKTKYEGFVDSLCTYIATEEGLTLTAEIRKEIEEGFCGFILDDSQKPKYVTRIASFFIAQQGNTELMRQCDYIRETLVAVIGLNYNTHESVEPLSDALTIYLDTEILFHAAGYNGELFKRLFDEFFSQVESYNRTAVRTGGKRIALRYFSTTKAEISNYFQIAEEIVRRNRTLDPSRTAMRTIVEGCIQGYEVREKEAALYTLLNEKQIKEEVCGINLLDETNWKYNIEDASLIAGLEETDRAQMMDSMRDLNFISIKRGGRNRDVFASIGYILLTGKGTTLRLSQNVSQGVPMAADLGYLTSRLWFMQNKGLGEDTEHINVDVLAKSRMALSAESCRQIGEQYKKAREQYKNGELSGEGIALKIATLRKIPVRPEEIANADDAACILDIEESINRLEKKLQKERDDNQIMQDYIIRQRQKEYRQRRDEYIQGMQAYGKRQSCKHLWKQLGFVTLHIILTVVFGGLSVMACLYVGWWGLIVAGITGAMPVVWPLVKYAAFIEAYKYVFNNSYRRRFLWQECRIYLKNNPVPVMESVDDISTIICKGKQ